MAKNKGLQKKYIKAAGGDFKKAWKLQKAGRKTPSRSKNRTKQNRSVNRTTKKKPIYIAPIIGIGIGVLGAKAGYDSYKAAGMTAGEAAIAAGTGLRLDAAGRADMSTHNSFSNVFARLAMTYGGPVAGIAVHSGVGGKNLFGTGIGLGLNRMMPGKIKL